MNTDGLAQGAAPSLLLRLKSVRSKWGQFTAKMCVAVHSGSFAKIMAVIAIIRPAVNPYRKMISID